MSDERDHAHLLLPLFLIASILTAVVPVLHPVGTCTDWLEKWGEASMIMTGWVRIHEMAMIGFAIAAAIGVFYPLLTPRSGVSIGAGACITGGFLIASMSVLIHATSASSLGRAYMHSTNPDERRMIRVVAEAFVAYDVGATSASSMLISAGCFLLVASLYLRRVMSLLPSMFFAGLSLVWAFQFHRVFNRMGFSLPETLHWMSLSLWFAGVGLFLFFRGRRLGAPAIAVAPPRVEVSTAE
jgi:hypothetical protein